MSPQPTPDTSASESEIAPWQAPWTWDPQPPERQHLQVAWFRPDDIARAFRTFPPPIPDIFVNPNFPWHTPWQWFYRPMNNRRFFNRFDWFRPGNIVNRIRKNYHLKFYTIFLVMWF